MSRIVATCRCALALAALIAAATPHRAAGQSTARRPLSPTDIDDIATLEMIEDRRQFDSTELARLLASTHPELRRRAAVTVARLANKRGIALLRARPLDADTAVAATVVFAVGQLKDSSTVSWFDSLLRKPTTAPTVATEAAVALGKIKTAAARDVLAGYLTRTVSSTRTNGAVGEALLSIGRSTARGDLAPIVRWTKSPSEELRWRATWALFRAHDPAAVPTLLIMSKDSSALVRSWALRGLTKRQADTAGIGGQAEARLLSAAKDPDRRVQTEAVRSLATYGDSAAIATLLVALRSADIWVAGVAAEGLGAIRSPATEPRLIAVTTSNRPCALRIIAMHSIDSIAPADVPAAAIAITGDSSSFCRMTGLQALAPGGRGGGRGGRGGAPPPTINTADGSPARNAIEALMGDPDPAIRLQARQAHWALLDAELDVDGRRAARRADLLAPDATIRAAALRGVASWADTTDLESLLDLYDRAQKDDSPIAASAAAAAIAMIQRRQGAGAKEFFARFSAPDNQTLRRDVGQAFGAGTPQSWAAAAIPARTLADYRQIVERWVVPDYEGKPRPTARWETPRGTIDLELYAGDAPLATEEFVRLTETGAIVGTEFTRMVPDFVDQQATIRDARRLRDEVNRHRLARGNLAWASSGLDTGSPGYTLNHTPQPHNEGDFTSLGRVVHGMDVVDRIQLGDRVTAARMLTGGSKH